jgi:hypothetical protein
MTLDEAFQRFFLQCAARSLSPCPFPETDPYATIGTNRSPFYTILNKLSDSVMLK